MAAESRLRRFEMHACLGKGGFGEVYRATMTSPGGLRSSVALKMLRDDLDVEAQAVRRLRDEARLLGALHHPSIVAVHDLTQIDGRLTLVTEYIDGQDLGGAMAFGPGVPLKVLVEVIGRVAGALHAAWTYNSPVTGEALHLVHRDVKPMNIRIGRHGEVKLLDFGVARAAGLDRDASTHPDATVGTYRYLAPEALDGNRSAPPVDIYALGVTFYKGTVGEGFYGRLPLTEQLRIAMDRGRYEIYLEQQLARIPGVSPASVRKLLGEMLAYGPGMRPTAEEVAQRCDDLLDDLSGLDLRRWCQARTWPPGEAVGAPLVGRHLEEQPLDIALDEPSNVKQMPSQVQTELLSRDVPTVILDEVPDDPAKGPGGVLLAVGAFSVMLIIGGAVLLIAVFIGIALMFLV